MPNEIHNGSRARDHMANERTFLAWIRTSIGIMVFGFVIEKFAIFLRNVHVMLGKANPALVPLLAPPPHTSFFGVFLVLVGVLLCLLAFVKFKRVEKEIEKNNYHTSILLNIMLVLVVLLIGVFLIIYLKHS